MSPWLRRAVVFASVVLVMPAVSVAQTPGINLEKKEVTVGAFTPVTGPVPFYKTLTDAAEAFFLSVNEKGGIRGWKVKFVTLDDGYDPARSLAATRRLVEVNKVFALVASVGTATNIAVIPYAKEQGLPMVGPIGGASQFFVEPGVFPLLPDYGWSAAANAAYAMDDLHKKRIALLWENDELGRSAKRGIDIYMKSRNASTVESISFDVKTTDFSPHIRKLQAANADAVILFGSNSNLAGALKTADRLEYKTTWFGPFFAADASTYKLAGDLLNGVYFSSWLLPANGDNPQVATYRRAFAQYFPSKPVGVFGLNGWSHAALFAVAFEKLLDSGKPLTRDNLVATLNDIHDVQVGGAPHITYRLGDHRGTRQEGILRAEKGTFKLVRDFKPYPEIVFNQKLD